MVIQTIKQKVSEARGIELPRLNRKPCFDCTEGFVSRRDIGVTLCPSCCGATYVIESEG